MTRQTKVIRGPGGRPIRVPVPNPLDMFQLVNPQDPSVIRGPDARCPPLLDQAPGWHCVERPVIVDGKPWVEITITEGRPDVPMTSHYMDGTPVNPDPTVEATELHDAVDMRLTTRERAILIAAIQPAFDQANKLVTQLASTVAMAEAMMKAVATPNEVKEILGFNNQEMEKKMLMVRELARDYQAVKARLEAGE